MNVKNTLEFFNEHSYVYIIGHLALVIVIFIMYNKENSDVLITESSIYCDNTEKTNKEKYILR